MVRPLAVVAGLAAAGITILYAVVMARQGSLSREAVAVGAITASFASSAVTLVVGGMTRRPRLRIALFGWGATVALFWTALLNTFTPLWLPVAVLGWVEAARSARAVRREAPRGDGWLILGAVSVACFALLAVMMAGSIMAGRSPSTGTGEGIAVPAPR